MISFSANMRLGMSNCLEKLTYVILAYCNHLETGWWVIVLDRGLQWAGVMQNRLPVLKWKACHPPCKAGWFFRLNEQQWWFASFLWWMETTPRSQMVAALHQLQCLLNVQSEKRNDSRIEPLRLELPSMYSISSNRNSLILRRTKHLSIWFAALR